MKSYHYRAKKSPNEVKEGVFQAESEEEVIAKVNDMGFVVVQIEEQTATKVSAMAPQKQTAGSSAVYRGLLGPAVTRFYKQLGRVIKSGIQILQALTLMSPKQYQLITKQITIKTDNM